MLNAATLTTFAQGLIENIQDLGGFSLLINLKKRVCFRPRVIPCLMQSAAMNSHILSRLLRFCEITLTNVKLCFCFTGAHTISWPFLQAAKNI